MSYERFLKDKLIKKQKPNFRQIQLQLQRSLKDLKTAEANLKIDLTWSMAISYHAMIRAGRALMYSKGFLPTARKSHKTIVEFTKSVLGHEYDTLVSKFNRLRRKRHNFIYDSKNRITHSEAISSLETAKKLVDEIIILVGKENPERNLL
ncbi:MAG: HEPN domain-containing protein [Candidatus Hydrothermarchaeota archaeon]